MSEGSLEDTVNEEIDLSKADPSVRRMLAANREAKKRSPAGSVLIERQKARGKFFPFGLRPNESRKIVVLSKPMTLLGHQVATRWVSKGSGFPDRSWAISPGWRMPDDPDQEGYESTGKPCLLTMALGDPRPVTVCIVAEFNKYTIKNGPNKGKESRVQVRVLEIGHSGARTQFAEQALTKEAGGSHLFTVMKVTRSESGTSPRVGDSFRATGKATKAQIQADKDIMEQLKDVDIAKAYAPLTEEEAIAALKTHKRIMDQHNNGEGYDPEGMRRALSGEHNLTGGLDDGNPFGDDDDEAGGGLGALDDVEENDTFTLGDSDDDEEPKEKKETAAVTESSDDDDDDDDFDPWES